MALNVTGNIHPALALLSHDLDAESCFVADVLPGGGVIFAGTFMQYDAGTKTLSKAVVGTDTVFGILADDIDSGPVGVTMTDAALVYRRGVFLRQQIEAINGVTIAEGDTLDLALNDAGIFLELSYE